MGYRELQGVSVACKRLQGVARGYIVLQGVTAG